MKLNVFAIFFAVANTGRESSEAGRRSGWNTLVTQLTVPETSSELTKKIVNWIVRGCIGVV